MQHINNMRDSLNRTSASTVDVYLDENCNTSTFSSMTQAFSQRISELQQLVCFRVEDSVKHIFVRDIQGIEQSVRALEKLFEDLRQRTHQEMSALPKARALLQATQLQQQHLQHISNNLPQHLPSIPLTSGSTDNQVSAAVAAKSAQGSRGPLPAAAVPASANSAKDDARGGPAAGKGQDKRRKDAAAGAAAVPASAPRWFVTAGEMASVPSYMKGRLTLEKVNAALDELAGFAESTHKSMTAVARNQLGRLGAEDRQRLHSMYHGFALKESVKGRYWFPETELKAGAAIKMDKTGKSILMLLRHLGRLAEVRATIEGHGTVTAYVIQAQS